MKRIVLIAALITTIIDKFNEFSDAQAFTAVEAATSTYSFDTKGADIGTGEDLYLVVQVDTAVTSTGAATVQIQYVESATADLGTPTVLYDSGAIAKTALTAGARPVAIKIPANTKRYVGVIYTVGTEVLATGSFSAYLCKDLQSAKTRVYPAGYTI